MKQKPKLDLGFNVFDYAGLPMVYNMTEPRWYHCGRQWLVMGDVVTCEEYAAHTAACIVNFGGILWAVLEREGDATLFNPKLGGIGPRAVPVPNENGQSVRR